MNIKIKDLYDETAKIQVKFAGYQSPFDVDMINESSRYGDKLRQDCKIGNFGENYWFRTEKGSFNNDNRYKTIAGLKRSIISAAKKRKLIVETFILAAK